MHDHDPRPWDSEISFGIIEPDPNPIREPAVASRTGRVAGQARVALIAVLAVAAGFAGLAVRSALADPAGPSTPEDAFVAFFAAIGDEDLAAVVELMPPAERESIADPIGNIAAELQRLELIDPNVDASHIGGIDLTVEGLQYSVSELDPRLVVITTTAGTVTPVSASLDELPLGSALDDAMAATDGSSVSVPVGAALDLGASPVSLAVLEVDGSWYVSLTYTAAEYLRRAAGLSFPGLGTGPAPVGGATPEEAVEHLATSLVGFDAAGVIASLDPVEMAALYDYSPLFLDEAQAGLDGMRTEIGSFRLDRLDLTTSNRSGRTLVTVTGIDGSFDPVDGTAGSPQSLDDLLGELGVGGLGMGELGMGDLGVNRAIAPSADAPGIEVVERDGRWYVRVMPTMLGAVVDALAPIEPSQIDSVLGDIESAVGSGLEEGLPGLGGAVPGVDSTDPPFGGGTIMGDNEPGVITNYVVVAPIPAGTPADRLLADGFVVPVDVDITDADFDSVWDLEWEVADMATVRDLEVGTTLMTDDFDWIGFGS